MQPKPASLTITFVARVAGLLLVWWTLTLGQWSALVFGAVVIFMVSMLSLRLFPPSVYRVRPLGLLRFIGYFMGRSVVAGVDVARRLLAPGLPINPGEVTVSLGLPEGSPRWLLANTLSLMPGTLSVLLEADQLTLHCLDKTVAMEPDVRRAEQHIARVFGLGPESMTGATS